MWVVKQVLTVIPAAPEEDLEHLEAHGVVVDREHPHAGWELVPLPPHHHQLLLLLHPCSAQKHPDSRQLKAGEPQSVPIDPAVGSEIEANRGANASREQAGRALPNPHTPAAPDSEARQGRERERPSGEVRARDAARGGEADAEREERKARGEKAATGSAKTYT